MTTTGKLGDSRFFQRTGPHSLAVIASVLGIEPPAQTLISDVAPLQTAGPDEVSFLDNRQYAAFLEQTKAGAVIVHPDFASLVPEGCVALVVTEPYVSWAKVASLFYPFPEARAGIHASAIIDSGAVIHPSVEIGAGAVISAGVEIGAGTMIGAMTYVAPGVVIGKNCRIHAQVTLSHAVLGERVVVYPGVRIGQDGFGFAITKTGFYPVPQLGRVLIGDGAEIGANSTIDRGSAQDTEIGPGVHIDNLVQIGHNVKIGAHSVVVAQAGISGSTQVGQGVMIAGQAGLIGHLTIGDGARIGAKAGVMQNIEAGAQVIGSPAQDVKKHFRELITLRKLAQTGRKERTSGT